MHRALARRAPLIVLSSLVVVLALGANVSLIFTAIAASAVCFTAAAVLLVLYGLPAESGPRRVTLSPCVVAGLAGLVLLMLSTLPLPGRLDILTGPRRYAENNRVREAVTLAAESGVCKPITPRFSVSRNRAGTTRIALFVTLALAGALLSATSTPGDRRRYLLFLSLLAGGFAAAGILHQWILKPPHRMVWWFFRVPSFSGSRPVGCFLNRDHYAGFLALLAPIPFVLLVDSIARKRWCQAPILAACFLLASAGVLASLSRGAFLAYCAAMLVTLLVGLHLGRRSLWLLVPAFVVCLLAGSLFVVAARQAPDHRIVRAVTARLETLKHPLQTHSGQSRLSMWIDGLAIWTRYPVLGAGADSFRMVYPPHRYRSDREASEHAENEYVEVLADTGLLGLLVLGWLVTCLAREWRRNNRRGLLANGISGAVLGSCTAAAVHAVFDFPLHTALYGLVFASLLGLVLSSPLDPLPTPDRKGLAAHYGIPAGLLILAGTLCLVATFVLGAAPFVRDSVGYMVSRARLNRHHELVRCLSGAPTSSFAWYSFARLGDQNFTTGDDSFTRLCIEQAIDYDPMNYLLWERVGYLRRRQGDTEGAAQAFEAMRLLRSWKRPRPFAPHRSAP